MEEIGPSDNDFITCTAVRPQRRKMNGVCNADGTNWKLREVDRLTDRRNVNSHVTTPLATAV